ncbi:MAG: sensor histidine kinase [Anaerolineae bacterium]|nr:sensor histidine kinase [Anaerolineae bacterium]
MTTERAPKTRVPNWLFHHSIFSLRGLPEIVASSGISTRLWRLYAQTWLVCLLFPIIFLVQTPLALGYLFIALAGLGIFVVIYTWFMWPHPLTDKVGLRFGFRTPLTVLTGLTVLVLYLSLAYGSAFLWLFVGVSAVIGIVLPAYSAFAAVVGLTLLTLAISVGLSGGIARTDWLHILPLVLLVRGLGLDMIGIARLAEALRELHAARSELAHQAVMEERLRLARDLHDLLGHTLSLITLKSELAGRLLAKEPARAAQEIQEIEREARQALREVREAVAGYRQPTLHSELAGARQMLEAAGIICTVEHTAGVLPSALDTVLAWTVREGVTNVIRHSRARRCIIRVSGENGRAYVEVTNDGYREQEHSPSRTKVSSGLAGLTERVTAHRGLVEAGPLLFEGNPGFRLWVELPFKAVRRISESSNDDPSAVS